MINNKSEDYDLEEKSNEKTISAINKDLNIPYKIMETENSDLIEKKHSTNDLKISRNLFKSKIKEVFFNYRKNASFTVEGIKVLYLCLALLSAESLIYLIFQIISLFLLKNIFESWITGLVLFICWLVLMAVCIYLVNEKKYFIAKIFKIFEFLVYFFFLGWTAGFFGFEALGLSYIILINFLIIFLFVILKDLLYEKN
jgi:hypothetical protein